MTWLTKCRVQKNIFWKQVFLQHPRWSTTLEASLWAAFPQALLSSFSESHRLWLASVFWEYFSRRFLPPPPLPSDLYGLSNSAINYCFMSRWKVLLFILSSDFFTWLREMIRITFSSPRVDKVDFDKGQEKRVGGRELHFRMHNNIIIIATIYLPFLCTRHCARFITFNL